MSRSTRAGKFVVGCIAEVYRQDREDKSNQASVADARDTGYAKVYMHMLILFDPGILV